MSFAFEGAAKGPRKSFTKLALPYNRPKDLGQTALVHVVFTQTLRPADLPELARHLAAFGSDFLFRGQTQAYAASDG